METHRYEALRFFMPFLPRAPPFLLGSDLSIFFVYSVGIRCRHFLLCLFPVEIIDHSKKANTMAKYKSMYKYELANAAGVSSDTFRRWLQSDRTKLKAMGVAPKQHLLPPKAVRYLCEKYDIEVG